MLVLITYDVSVATRAGERRLRNIAKACLDYGVRVQKSVFECDVEPSEFTVLKDRLLTIYDEEEDSLRFYYLGKSGRRRVEHHGAHSSPDPVNDVLVL